MGFLSAPIFRTDTHTAKCRRNEVSPLPPANSKPRKELQQVAGGYLSFCQLMGFNFGLLQSQNLVLNEGDVFGVELFRAQGQLVLRLDELG